MIALGIVLIVIGGIFLLGLKGEKGLILFKSIAVFLIIGGIANIWLSIDDSSSSNSHSSSYSSGSGSGYSSKYDKDLDDIANAYGTDRDTVNNILNGLADAMR